MKKILLVEDNEAIQKGLKYSLEQEKFVVELASDVKTAKDKLVKSEFNLIILDVMLPDGSGFELCRDIKKNMTTPILFLTAKDEEQDVVNGFDLGADDYVVKPFRPRELISRINNILKRYEKEERRKHGNEEIWLLIPLRADLRADRRQRGHRQPVALPAFGGQHRRRGLHHRYDGLRVPDGTSPFVCRKLHGPRDPSLRTRRVPRHLRQEIYLPGHVLHAGLSADAGVLSGGPGLVPPICRYVPDGRLLRRG